MFPKEKIIGWLSWLAGKMREHSQSVFLVEGLQPSWLGTRAKRVAYGTVVALSLGLIFGLICRTNVGLTELTVRGRPRADRRADLRADYSRWSRVRLLVGIALDKWRYERIDQWADRAELLGANRRADAGTQALRADLRADLRAARRADRRFRSRLAESYHLVETISWKWNQFWKRTIPGSIFGLIVRSELASSGRASSGRRAESAARLFNMLLNGLIFGLFGGLISGLVGGFTDRVKVGKASPNQGIKLSRKNSLTVFLVTLLTRG